MLQRLSRLFLIVLLLAAIPAQGLAAISMGICRAAHDGQAAGLAAHADSAQEALGAHGHDGHDAQPAASQDGTASADAHCAACAACGTAAGISPPLRIGVANLLSDRIRPDRDQSRAGITPASLDRPPLSPPA